MKRIGTAAAAVAILLLVAGPATAQEFNYPPGDRDITLADTTVACPGGTVAVSGSGFADNVEIDIFFDDILVTSVFPDQEGAFSASFTAPEAAAGTHTVTAVQVLPDGTVLEQSATITCVVAAAPGLAVTGANISMGLLLLAGLIVVGAVALVAGRRRSRTSA